MVFITLDFMTFGIIIHLYFDYDIRAETPFPVDKIDNFLNCYRFYPKNIIQAESYLKKHLENIIN